MRLTAWVIVVGLLVGVGSRPAADEARSAPRAVAPGVRAIRLRAVDGGVDYYGHFTGSLPSDPSFFPIGVWFAGVLSQGDVDKDRAVGLNTYVRLTDDSDLTIIGGNGLFAVAAQGPAGETVPGGWLLEDEVDMWAGPGWSRWSGNGPSNASVCVPAEPACGYTVMTTLARHLPEDGRLRYANYGKGVTFWESGDEARVFVNQFQDVVSADNYWFTDPNICGPSEGGRLLGAGTRALTAPECRRAANYGATVDRVRDLVRPRGSKPVWAIVEVGQPFTDSSVRSIRPAQVSAAVWSAIIHGARGIVYFAHNFGGRCITQNALRGSCGKSIQRTVAETDRRIGALAPVLNAPFADGYVTVTRGIDTMAKYTTGSYYIFAGSRGAHAATATFGLACADAAVATVVDENRTIRIVDGSFSDTFATANSVHIYRVEATPSCAPE